MELPDLKKLATDVHRDSVVAGWWSEVLEEPVYYKTSALSVKYKTSMLSVVAAVSKAHQGFHSDETSEYSPEHKTFEVELTRATMQLLDLAGAFGAHFMSSRTVLDRIKKVKREMVAFDSSVPEQLYRVVTNLSKHSTSRGNISEGLVTIIAVAELNNVNLWEIFDLKRAHDVREGSEDVGT